MLGKEQLSPGRTVTVTGGAIFLLLCGVLVWQIVDNPLEEQREWLNAELTAVRNAERGGDEYRAADFAGMEDAIRGKDQLWRPVVPEPEQAPPTPDLDAMLRGVSITRESMGSGDSLRVRVRTSGNRRGEWKGVGDQVNDLTIKEITDSAVVFSLVSHGTEYTKELSRG